LNAPIFGTSDARFTRVKEAFTELWQGPEVGASLCIFLEGKKVVDLWGGWQDRARTRDWTPDTLVNIYSTTKGIVALALAKLVNEDLLAYDEVVGRYWPEFNQNGKAGITVGQLLSHQAGLCAFDQPLAVTDLYNWQSRVERLAAAAPKWPPGSAAGYHSITWGFLAGELIRRVTGELPGHYLRKHLAEPHKADCHIGLSARAQAQCADLIGPNHALGATPATPSGIKKSRTPLVTLTQDNPRIRPFADACSADWRRAEIPASNGHASARGLATLYQAALSQHAQFVRTDTLQTAITTAVEDKTDLILQTKIKRSQGGFILNEGAGYGPDPRAFGHNGTGGSSAFAALSPQVAFAYVPNQMLPEGLTPRAPRLADLFYDCL